MNDVAAFLMVAVVVIVTPGPDTALTIRNTLLGGRGSGVFTAAGVAVGQATWAIATSLGVAALLAGSEPVFVALRLVGAAYLAFLGTHALLGALRSSGRSRGPAAPVGSERAVAPRVAFRQGVVSNLTNPKMAAFFPSLLPQFAPRDEAAFSVLVLLGLVFCLMTLVWLTAYAIVLAKAGTFVRRPSVRRTLEGLTGAVLLALGLRLALDRH
jgi:threonine/homoserine/homoserine lactone efflux protein